MLWYNIHTRRVKRLHRSPAKTKSTAQHTTTTYARCQRDRIQEREREGVGRTQRHVHLPPCPESHWLEEGEDMTTTTEPPWPPPRTAATTTTTTPLASQPIIQPPPTRQLNGAYDLLKRHTGVVKFPIFSHIHACRGLACMCACVYPSMVVLESHSEYRAESSNKLILQCTLNFGMVWFELSWFKNILLIINIVYFLEIK